MSVRVGQGLAVAVLAVVGITGPASSAMAVDNCKNEANTPGSVDGKELAYDLHTKYTNQWKDSRTYWNNYGTVKIVPDGAFAYADISVSDANNSSVTWSGRWSTSAGADDIKINDAFVKNYSYEKQRGVVGHELGHALKLGHFDNRGALMHCNDNRTVSAPQQADKDKYKKIWG